MTAIRLDQSETANPVNVVEMAVWAVLAVAGLGVVVWGVIQFVV